ncbi:MAG: GNAT family N-acetyltransferase, partial [Gammaproteobacteria bacterium]|nr:GNAT family N-acetyltransferase [Gammaproteobacteria bacterium]
MHIRVRDSISTIEPADWNGLLTRDDPFLRHEFLLALEESGSVSRESGWSPCHLTCENDSGELLGALPLYLKDNSYGEFVFDFAWASAYQQAGLAYYPKLVCSVPFTPVTGSRLLVAGQQANRDAIRSALVEGAINCTSESGASSLHVLFPDKEETPLLERSEMLLRKDCQFHWHNRNYMDFDHFLAGFTSAKRKKARRERRRIEEQGIRFEVRTGNDLDEAAWQEIMPLYRTTFLRRGREPYLEIGFFLQLSATLPDSLVVFLGYAGDELVAVAICFRSDTSLYGRYWGAN